MELENSNQKLAQAYNDLNYTSKVFYLSQPVRLHALAKIKGLEPEPLETARVLEIGCSFGGNILPFAIQYPKSTIVGIDLSENQINIGKQMLDLVGVDNISLIAGDISQISFEHQFDYIICHGVFSWVPEFVKQAILETVKRYLSPNGIAYISYNTYPGWKAKEIIRDLMLFGSDSNLSIASRMEQAVELLKFTDELNEDKQGNMYSYIKQLSKQAQEYSRYYLAHEQFAEYNDPLYFKDFIARLDKQDLAYLTDSSSPNILFNIRFKDDEYQKICNYFNFRLENVEQYLDFLDNRQFRSSLICHRDNLLRHNINNNTENYKLCYDFYNLSIYHPVNFYPADGNTPSYWSAHNSGIRFWQSPLNDALFNYLSKQQDYCKVQDIFDALKSLPEYNEEALKSTLWMLIHDSHTHLSFSPVKRKKAGRKPNIPEKLRNLIQFVLYNPNVTTYSNIYYNIVELSPVSAYFSRFLDGTRGSKELISVFRECLENKEIIINKDNQPLESSDITDAHIKKEIKLIIEELAFLGYFNHF